MELEAVGITDVGLEREHNEDAFLLMPEADLCLVADGMGGHRAGDVASGLAVATIAEFFRASESGDSTWPYRFDPTITFEENRLLTAIQLANAAILRQARSQSQQQGMGTTIVAVIGSRTKNRLYICHVGDSRCYRVRNESIEQLTVDHSLYNEYAQSMPELGEERLAALPRNVITRALGMQEEVKVDLKQVEAQVGDVYLLCSDGLSGMINDARILQALRENEYDLDRSLKALVTGALEAGGEDNVTIVLVRVKSLAPRNRSSRTPAAGKSDEEQGPE
ncbi:MAG: Stp1/IreP family PP2C-type Ser/Thr phosphatase [Deltaproteobacteria bacterium]|nr:Stp1/IreP family PP2C-type Ser/Thr phosphatase [Deltaproteobacteria bacterium]